MKLLFLFLVGVLCVQGLHVFECYAGAMTWGPWTHSGLGVFGKARVTLEFEALGDTTAHCRVDCCGQISPAGFDQISCQWDCAGQPAIQCYGNPLGSPVRVFQT